MFIRFIQILIVFALSKIFCFYGTFLKNVSWSDWASYWVEFGAEGGQPFRKQTWAPWNVDSQMKRPWNCGTPGIHCKSFFFYFVSSFSYQVFKGKRKKLIFFWWLRVEEEVLSLLANLQFSRKTQHVRLFGSWHGCAFQVHAGSWGHGTC